MTLQFGNEWLLINHEGSAIKTIKMCKKGFKIPYVMKQNAIGYNLSNDKEIISNIVGIIS